MLSNPVIEDVVNVEVLPEDGAEVRADADAAEVD
jgi:hypothetical protein